jgi:hypothetical protein
MPTPEAEDFKQLALRFIDPIQHDYEVIRDVVLVAETTERATATGLDRSTVGEKARRFVEDGMLGLADQRATKAWRTPHPFPERRHVVIVRQGRQAKGCIIEG